MSRSPRAARTWAALTFIVQMPCCAKSANMLVLGNGRWKWFPRFHSLTTPTLCGARIMADSDHSTTMPFVTNGKDTASNRLPDADPPILLLRDWLRAQHVSQVLCRLQQRLE